MEPEGLLLCSQDPDTFPYPELDACSLDLPYINSNYHLPIHT